MARAKHVLEFSPTYGDFYTMLQVNKLPDPDNFDDIDVGEKVALISFVQAAMDAP